jgi:hypothetical protein
MSSIDQGKKNGQKFFEFFLHNKNKKITTFLKLELYEGALEAYF